MGPTHHNKPVTTNQVAFGAYRMDRATGELWRDGNPVRLRRQPSRLLALLLARPNRLVTREEIIRHLWGERIVEYDQGLHACVRQIREALGDSAVNPVWVETVPRSGYRFIGAVRPFSRAKLRRPAGMPIRLATIPALLMCLICTASQSWPPDTGARIVVEAGPDHRGVAAAIAHQAHLLSGITRPRIVADRVKSTASRLVVVADDGDTVQILALGAGLTAHELSQIALQNVAALVRGAEPVDTPPRHVRDAFRQGQFVLESHDDGRLERAMGIFHQVIAQAPKFAPAHAAVAHAHLMRGEYPPARRAAQRALVLDSNNAAAHMTLANVALYADWDRHASAQHHRAVLDRFPGWSMAHVSYAYLLSGEGRHDEALAHARLALELDPVSPIVHGDLGLLYLLAGRFDNAVVHCRRTLELDPEQWFSRACLVDALLAAGDSSQAQQEAVQLMEAFEAGESQVAVVRDAAPYASFEAYWRWTLTWALPRNNRWYPYFAARAYVGLNEFSNAVTTLIRAADEHAAIVAKHDTGGRRVVGTAMFPALRVDPRFTPLHDDARFAKLVSRIAGG